MSSKLRILKLTNDDLIIGDSEAIDDNNVSVTKPYSIYDLGHGPALAPYMIYTLMEPMDQITIRLYDVMWSKALEDFPQVHDQYIQATTGIQTEQKEQIII